MGAGDSLERILLKDGAATELGACQVRSETAHPCLDPAVVKICGISFCASCAQEQEAYFAIGKLTMDAQGRVATRELAEHIVEASPEVGRL